MKMKRNWLFKLAVIFCFGLIIAGCASSPSRSLSQAEMRLDDPRMPPDRFNRSERRIDWYWLGSQASELSADQVSILWLPYFVSKLRIDGKAITLPDLRGSSGYYFFIYLTPEKHTLTFSYKEKRKMEAFNGTYLGDLYIDFPDTKREIVMEPGKVYGIYVVTTDPTKADWATGTRYATPSLIVDEWAGDYVMNSGLWRTFGSYTPPALKEAKSRKYFEPYDSSLPLEKQAFLETKDGLYIVGFNGETVSWGWKNVFAVTIGIPEGKHELRLVKNNVFYDMILDCLPGCRYVFRFNETSNTIRITNVTGEKEIPGAAKRFYDNGVAFFQEKKWDAAIQEYSKAIDIYPEYANAYNNRGWTYYNKGDYDLAMADYSEAIRLNPNYDIAYTNRGMVYRRKGDNDLAIAEYNKAIGINPNNANAYNNRGFVYNIKGDYDRAIEEYNEAIRLKPNDANQYNNRGLAYTNKGDYKRAIADFQTALKINPNYTDAKNNLENARQAQKR